MKLRACDEDRLIAQLTRGFARTPEVKVGIGDDCAVLVPAHRSYWQLLKTDCLVEGVHYAAGTEPARIGWKALARPLSDIAAMGGLPRHALITVAIHRDKELPYLKGIFRGIDKLARRFGVVIVGGETSRSPGPDFISVCVTGTVKKSRCITRAGGRAGDWLYVTGRLGGSIRGRHLDFIPRIAEGRWLAEHFRIHAMMDLSDGLGTDLPRLAAASGTGFELWEDKLPRHKGVSAREAISDGEDYELLFAIASRQAGALENAWKRRFPKLPLTAIGCLTATPATRQQIPRGYDHFA